ncbi:hypothetical protein RO3G_11388 [Rhizopus delemar RA 99-880]|uniref:Uncharacterized protein n=1 Tax=Rhizopus delemar (strain RA 99-880 / ATCC MYA-4621 / FGSC 9543 / NRRL 43880) TaxID=246409 RepID=I1CDZ7_RHIO9|nr:hypothetical protein RO3G_11388 [Rhizopus delemar RA 99-880]|eukprot:EIE86677.1 hypothetical protein RO3G_11388 [Rhizopus delemar RA 99-880]
MMRFNSRVSVIYISCIDKQSTIIFKINDDWATETFGNYIYLLRRYGPILVEIGGNVVIELTVFSISQKLRHCSGFSKASDINIADYVIG